ncbi:hypothetical protein G7075_15035 [Phycicoccus sp. HDW14]|uniref:hypothetical protein n=1 Tax=Phycicoccus sp. HDW14 TaxID=2714941 RepID=UPI00140E03B9|nr:hypothetical protein [Phycicoccus sp. HDW14]QIM22146.1 hypothetical protein G7075_15035 [Phycicoccus sp. HDW14]
MTPRPHLPAVARRPSGWTLRTKLLAAVLALFTVVTLATSALTVLETRRYLDSQLTQDLQNALGRAGDRGGVFDDDGTDGPPAPAVLPGLPARTTS